MMVYEMLDITFFIMSLKIPTKSFDINGFIEFSDKALRSESSHKLITCKVQLFSSFLFQPASSPLEQIITLY